MNEVNRVAAVQRCCYGGPGAYCGEPAAIHVWLEGDLGTMSCSRHASWWDTHPHRDQHPIGGACGLPGTTWHVTLDGDPGWCDIEGLTAEDLAGVDAAELVAL